MKNFYQGILTKESPFSMYFPRVWLVNAFIKSSKKCLNRKFLDYCNSLVTAQKNLENYHCCYRYCYFVIIFFVLLVVLKIIIRINLGHYKKSLPLMIFFVNVILVVIVNESTCIYLSVLCRNEIEHFKINNKITNLVINENQQAGTDRRHHLLSTDVPLSLG